jgi:hypothetical protein
MERNDPRTVFDDDSSNHKWPSSFTFLVVTSRFLEII